MAWTGYYLENEAVGSSPPARFWRVSPMTIYANGKLFWRFLYHTRCPGSSATGVHLLATSRRDFVLTKAVDGVGAPTEAAGPRALAAKQRTARLGAKTHSRGPRCLRRRLGQPNDAHFKGRNY